MCRIICPQYLPRVKVPLATSHSLRKEGYFTAPTHAVCLIITAMELIKVSDYLIICVVLAGYESAAMRRRENYKSLLLTTLYRKFHCASIHEA